MVLLSRSKAAGVLLRCVLLPCLLIGQSGSVEAAAHQMAAQSPSAGSLSTEAQRTQSQVRFTFERAVPGVLVPRYVMLLRSDGTGEYKAETTITQTSGLQRVERPLVFTPATVKSALEAIHLLRSSGVPCASKLKNIADTGTKTLEYRDGDGDGTCTYNYSENKGAMQLTDLFQGVELTLEAGRALDFKHRFDRLGLDAEIASLTTEVESGHALELGNIASTLRSIAGDTDLIQRVRLRAAKLLERAQAGA